MRKKKNRDARLSAVCEYLLREPHELRSNPEPPHGKFELELGSGRGAFATALALACPEVRLIALERELNALLTAAELAQSLRLPNLRFLPCDAASLSEYFRPGEVSRLYINFCDPWPANRHAHRRLTAPRFLELYRTILTPGGELFLKTDDAALFEFSRRSLETSGWRVELGRGVEWLTDYERKFIARGVPILKLAATCV
jgi:tRNA (guanine-N7-)-methyltransferase